MGRRLKKKVCWIFFGTIFGFSFPVLLNRPKGGAPVFFCQVWSRQDQALCSLLLLIFLARQGGQLLMEYIRGYLFLPMSCDGGGGQQSLSFLNHSQWRNHVVSVEGDRCVCWVFVSFFSWRNGVVHVICDSECRVRSCRRDFTNRPKLIRWTERHETIIIRFTAFPVILHF